MTLDEMHWMVTLFQSEKMSTAAERLYISQPALSQCLQRIETQLGFKLFERSNKGLKPTPKGLLFYQTAEKITDTYNAFLTQAKLLDQTELQEITIGMAPFVSSCCSADILQALSTEYPNIRFRVYEAFTPDLIKALYQNAIQIIVINEPISADNVMVYRFGTLRYAIFLRRESPVAKYAYTENGIQYLDPKYLRDEPICATYPGQSSRTAADAIFAEIGITPRIVHESRNVSTLYRYARENISSAIGPLTGPVMELDSQRSKSLIYRMPPTYPGAKRKMAICAMPDISRIMPDQIFRIIETQIIRNPTAIVMD